MALQKALSQLRNSTLNTAHSVKNKDEGINAIPVTEYRSSTNSVFSMDDSDLFNFDEDDFLSDSFSLTSSSSTAQPIVSASSTVTTISNSITEVQVSGTRTDGFDHSPASSDFKLTQKEITSRHGKIVDASINRQCLSGSQSTSMSRGTTITSPSVASSVKKLQSFKFVKAGKKRPSDVSEPGLSQSSSFHPPQTKRRLVCDSGISSNKNQDVNNCTSKCVPFKQPAFNPRTGSSCSVPGTPTMTTPSNSARQNEATPINQVTTPISSFPLRRTPVSNFSTPLSSAKHTPQSQQITHFKPASFNQTPLSSCNNKITTPSQSEQVISTPRNRSATPIICTPTNNRIIGTTVSVRRKFPGPAGLLPSLPPGQNLDSIIIPPSSTPQPASTPRTTILSASDLPCSESESDPADFSRGPWVDMLEDLDMTDVHSSGLLQYSIHSMIKQAAKKTLKGGKAVHLRVLVKNLVPAGNNASAVLKDPTGEILCTIHHKVLEEHQKELQPGSVLVLRQVSVFSPTPRKHYLNITPNNIVRIYPPESNDTRRIPLVLSDIENRSSKDDFSNLHRPEHSLSRQSQTLQQENRTCKKPLHSTSRMSFLNPSRAYDDNSLQNSRTKNAQCTVGPSRCDDERTDCLTPMETELETDFNETNVLFEDLDNFEDFADDSRSDVPPTDTASSGVCPNITVVESLSDNGRASSKNVRREVLSFFNQFCEDEFDDLVNDIDF